MPTVLILGASSDMAVAIARTFASHVYDIQLASRNVNRLIPLQSDLQIRGNIKCTLHDFDAIDFNSHESFFSSLSTKPDITICVFGYMVENEVARSDWKQSERMIHTNYTGAV